MKFKCVICGQVQENFLLYVIADGEEICVGCETAITFGLFDGKVPRTQSQEMLSEKMLDVSSKMFLAKWEQENGFADWWDDN